MLRTVRYWDWFSTHELNDALGVVDATGRNTVTRMICRLRETGHLERRRLSGSIQLCGLGSPYEYKITRRGIGELTELMQGKFTGSKLGWMNRPQHLRR